MQTQNEFLRYERNLLSALSVTNNLTGVDYKITGNEKIVYRYMLERFQFFLSKGGKYFDNQTDIQVECGMSLRTVQRAIYRLIEIGLVNLKTERLDHCGARLKNFYEVENVFTSKFTLNSAKQKKSKVESNKIYVVQDNEDDFEPPF